MSQVNWRERMASVLHMNAVYISGTYAKLSDTYEPLLPGQQLVYFHRFDGVSASQRIFNVAQNGVPSQIKNCLVTSTISFRYFRARLVDGKPQSGLTQEQYTDDEMVAELVTDYVASYRLLVDEMPPEEELKEYAKLAQLDLWPFHREHIAATTAKMCLPVVFAPVFSGVQDLQPLA